MSRMLPLATIAAALSTVMATTAFASDSHIANDVRRLEQDHARVHADVDRVREERAELERARRQEARDLAHGDFRGAVRAFERDRHEQAELSAARRKLDADAAAAHRDRADLQRDVINRHSYWW